MPNHWTRERIIRHLLEREAQGLPLSVGGEGVEGVDRLMYAAARRIFGSWRHTLQAAGIAPARVLTWERWSPARILVMIRHLARRARPLTTDQMERRYGNLVSTARRHFGSWSKAVVAAGVEPTKLQRVVPWNQERILEAILTRALRNQTLARQHVEPRSLVDASQRLFGSWDAAVTAAGLDPKMIVPPPRRAGRLRAEKTPAPRPASLHAHRQPWTKEMVVAAIQARLAEQKTLYSTAVARDDNSLYRAARRHLKSWNHAMRAAGLDPSEYQRCPNRRVMLTEAGPHAPMARPSQATETLRPD